MATAELDQLSENVPFAKRHGMWFMYDGGAASVAREVKNFPVSQYADRYMGRNGQGCVLRDRSISLLLTQPTRPSEKFSLFEESECGARFGV
jgi:hypothetical protein